MYRLVRYADDFVVLVSGTEAQAEGLREEVAAVLSTVGLCLSEEKTRVCHIDEGFDFLGYVGDSVKHFSQESSKTLTEFFP